MSNPYYPRSGVYRLYFGTDVPEHRREAVGRSFVTPTDWGAFVSDVIGPVLPGWTEWLGTGAWQDKNTGAPVNERTYIVETFTDDLNDLRPTIYRIASTYAQRFGQDEVAVVEVPAGVTFVPFVNAD